jgi:malonyl CoA-acyl carrier protein transacylase
VTQWLKAGTVESENTAAARKRLDEQDSATINKHPTTREVLKTSKAKQDRKENIRGLNLTAVKLTTVRVTNLPLYHKLNKIGMNCVAKPELIVKLKLKKLNSVA